MQNPIYIQPEYIYSIYVRGGGFHVTQSIYAGLYHDDYLVGSYDWNSDESSLFFTVYGHSDQGEGAEWEEEWAIDRDGKIYDGETIHNSLEDFKNNW